MDELLRQAGSWPGRWLEPAPPPPPPQQQQEKDQEGVGRAAEACEQAGGKPGLALGRKYWAERVSRTQARGVGPIPLSPACHPRAPYPLHRPITPCFWSSLCCHSRLAPTAPGFAHACRPCNGSSASAIGPAGVQLSSWCRSVVLAYLRGLLPSGTAPPGPVRAAQAPGGGGAAGAGDRPTGRGAAPGGGGAGHGGRRDSWDARCPPTFSGSCCGVWIELSARTRRYRGNSSGRSRGRWQWWAPVCRVKRAQCYTVPGKRWRGCGCGNAVKLARAGRMLYGKVQNA